MKTKSFLQIFAITALVSFILMWSCKKNTTATPGGPNQSPPVEYVTATVTGRVIDKNKQPVSGAAISTAFASTTTDVNGQFILTNTQLDKNAGYVIAKKGGYFNGSKTFQLTAGASNYIEIELITKNQSGQFTASAGGTVTISNGGSINFSANSIADSLTGAAYSGIVTVSAFFLDPSAANFGNIMPGELLGIANDSSEKGLQSFGMMVAELTGSSGQKLQIATGKTATITFPVPASLISSAPAKIPLWYFDEVKGLWREQDSATLQSNNYVANVSHFSFWNCDAPFPTISFQALIKDQNGNPVSAAKVAIEDPNDSVAVYSYGYTNGTGVTSGKIPSNKNLRILIYTRCGDLIYEQNFATSNSNLDLGTINTTIQAISVTFSGTVTNCSGTAITSGILSIFLDNVFTSANISNGNFSVTVFRCYSTAAVAQIIAVDLSTNLIDTVSVNNVTNSNISSLTMETCNQSDEYIYYTLKGINDSLILGNYSFSNNKYINGYPIEIIATGDVNTANYFHIYFEDTTAINSPQTNLLISLTNYDSSYGTNTLTLTEFGSIGNGFIAGSFSGEVIDMLNGYALVPIQGIFRIKRTN